MTRARDVLEHVAQRCRDLSLSWSSPHTSNVSLAPSITADVRSSTAARSRDLTRQREGRVSDHGV
eukprot:772003-Rhodomonas_salina.1